MNYVVNLNKDDIQVADKGSYAVNNNNDLNEIFKKWVFLNRRK